jgi:pyruvate/2-oxoglutarate dehydrogenase complex dihydrolipoamide dehydrogenase (E3) component
MSRTRPELNLHPQSHHPSSLRKQTYDVIVIGGGPTGETTASTTAAKGLSTLLVESELVGGECPYWACVPSKALLRPREALLAAAGVGGAREKVGSEAEAKVDLKGVWDRRDNFTKRWDDAANVKMMEGAKVDVVRGFGGIVGERRVGVRAWDQGRGGYVGEEDAVVFEAKMAVVIATGSMPVIPEIEGLVEVGYWTPREAVSAREVPEHLIVLGAGAVGVEMATAYAGFGARVTLVSHSGVLPRVCEEARRRVEGGLKAVGVDVRSDGAKSVKRENGKVTLTLASGDSVFGTEILVAVGRKARTVGMGLNKVGTPSEGAWIQVDESSCALSVKEGWLYAAGDPNGVSLTTHMGRYQAIITANSIVAKSKGVYTNEIVEGGFSRISRKPTVDAVPQVVFSDPQVAWVGLSASAAKEKKLNVREVSAKMAGPGTFLHTEDYDGWAQWVVENGTGRIFGAIFVGRDVADLLHASTVAVATGLSWKQMFHAVPSFPTVSEIYHNLVEACAASESS